MKAADLVILCSVDTQSEVSRYRVDEIWKGHRFAQPILTNGFLVWEYSLRDMTPQPEAILLTLKTGGKKAEPTSLLDAEFHFFYKNPELGEDINVSTLKKIKDTSELE